MGRIYYEGAKVSGQHSTGNDVGLAQYVKNHRTFLKRGRKASGGDNANRKPRREWIRARSEMLDLSGPLVTNIGFALRLEGMDRTAAPRAENFSRGPHFVKKGQLCNKIDIGVAPRSSLVRRGRTDQHCRAMQLCSLVVNEHGGPMACLVTGTARLL